MKLYLKDMASIILQDTNIKNKATPWIRHSLMLMVEVYFTNEIYFTITL